MGTVHRGVRGLAEALETRQAVHGDRTLREISGEQCGLRRCLRRRRIAAGSGCRDVAITPTQQSINGIERRDRAPRIVLAQRKRSRQHDQLPEFCRRPLDAPTWRKAPIREFRDVPLQTDR
jgi:hypothetical protein